VIVCSDSKDAVVKNGVVTGTDDVVADAKEFIPIAICSGCASDIVQSMLAGNSEVG
jgi:hypothetical protein